MKQRVAIEENDNTWTQRESAEEQGEDYLEEFEVVLDCEYLCWRWPGARRHVLDL